MNFIRFNSDLQIIIEKMEERFGNTSTADKIMQEFDLLKLE